jgi:hypothetical protein
LSLAVVAEAPRVAVVVVQVVCAAQLQQQVAVEV